MEVPTPPSLLAKVEAIVAAYERGDLGGKSHELYPGVPIGSRERFLYFTLAPALNYQRRSEGLWKAALSTWMDDQTRFAFYPEEVPRGKDEFSSALRKHGLAVQPVRHAHIWYTLLTTLFHKFGSDPRLLLSGCGYDVERIKNLLAKESRDFPYLSGPKLSNYWLFMLDSFTDVNFVNRQLISIIPDVHVRRATQILGLAPDTTPPERVAAIWRDILSASALAPCDVHAPLWRWSRAGFPSVPL